MTLYEKQQRLLDDFLVIPDAQERLATIVARAARSPALTSDERIRPNRVPACGSTVWLIVDLAPETRRLRVRSDAESPLIKGLVALLCELYDDSAPGEAATFQSELLEKLQITQNLSLTRRNGLAAVQTLIGKKAEKLKSVMDGENPNSKTPNSK